jgi:hypothetical protein
MAGTATNGWAMLLKTMQYLNLESRFQRLCFIGQFTVECLYPFWVSEAPGQKSHFMQAFRPVRSSICKAESATK